MLIDGFSAVGRLVPFLNNGKYGLGAGANPDSPTPFNAAGRCDCIAAVMWAWKQRRHDSRFPEYEGDINVDSALMDAGFGEGAGKKLFFKPIHESDIIPGDLIAFPSVRAHEVDDTALPPQSRIRIGHIGMFSGYGPLSLIIDCADRIPAITRNNNTMFRSRTQVTWKDQLHQSERWQSRFLRYVGPSRAA